jgi:hypothetical protein
VSLDLGGLSVTPEGITGALTLDQSDLLVNGEPPTIDRYTASFDLQELDGEVVGEISLIGISGAAKNDAVLSGLVEINTALCELYPAGGTITMRDGNQLITITFSPDCDGEYEYTVTDVPEPTGWDFDYRYWDPRTPEAQEYIVSTQNAVLSHDYYDEHLFAWSQENYGNCLDQPPGLITYRFEFPQPVLDAYLRTENRGRQLNDEVSGSLEIRGSNNGESWHTLKACDWGADYTNVYCDFEDFLPDQLLGTRELWVEVELCCRDGSGTVNPPCWMAVHSLFNSERPPGTFPTFQLSADYLVKKRGGTRSSPR